MDVSLPPKSMSTNEAKGGPLSSSRSEVADGASEEDDAVVSADWEGSWSVDEDDRNVFEGAWLDGEDGVSEGGLIGRLFLIICHNSRYNEKTSCCTHNGRTSSSSILIASSSCLKNS
jgi:hypothetical protein